jgi:hypothetical protein
VIGEAGSDMNPFRDSAAKAFALRLIARPALWVFLVTFIVLAIHPIPECVACEYPRPWGRDDAIYAQASTLLAAWLVVASLAAGAGSVRRNWLVPVSIVIAHLATQPIGGVPLWSLWSNEGPMILLLGSLTGAVGLLVGYLARLGVGQLRTRFRGNPGEAPSA